MRVVRERLGHEGMILRQGRKCSRYLSYSVPLQFYGCLSVTAIGIEISDQLTQDFVDSKLA